METNQLNYEEMEALRLTALDLTSELELNQLLNKIIQRAVELLKANGGGIYRYDEARGSLTVVADCGGGITLLGNTLKVGEGMAGQVVQTKKEMIIDDYSQWEGRATKLNTEPFRAVIGVPLVTPANVLGVLYVTSYVGDRRFNSRDAHFLMLLASHAAIAIANAEEFDEHRRTLRQLKLLNKLNERLNHALSLNEILQFTLEEALTAVRAIDGSIMMRDEKSNELEIRAWIVHGAMSDHKGHKRFASDEGIAGYVARTGQPYNCTDTSRNDHFVGSFTGRKIRSLLSVPIFLHDNVFCIINADSDQPDYFNDSDIKMLSAMAGHVAIAIESQLLRDVGISLSTSTLEDLYPQIVESAAMLTGSQSSTIFLADDKSDSIERAALFPSSLQSTEDEVKGDKLSRHILDEGKLVAITDAQNSDLIRQSVKNRGVQSLMGAPLTVRLENNTQSELKTIGVLFVSTTRARQFDKRDEEILQSLANQAAIVIERTKNFAELKENVRFNESLLKSAFDAIIAVNESGEVMICNQSAERILGLSSAEVIGRDANQYFLRREDADKVTQLLKEHDRVASFYTDLKSHSGETIPIRLSVVRLEKGSVGFFQDRRELESARRHIEQLQQLMEAGQAITALGDVNRVLKTAVVKTIETLKADLVSLYQYNYEQDEIFPPIRAGRLLSKEPKEPVFTKAIIREVLRQEDIYFADDVQNDTLLGGDFVKREQLNSSVACPLKVGNKIVGVILCSYREPHPFTDEEKAMMRLYFSGVAIAIENARLYEEVQQRAKVEKGLYKAGLLFKVDLSLEKHLRNLLEQAQALTDARYVAIEIPVSEWKAEPLFIFSEVNTEAQKKGATPPAAKVMLGLLPAPNTVLNLPDVTKDSQYMSLSAKHPEMTSLLCVPITLGGKSIGSFYVANKQVGAHFSSEDEDYLGMLAGHAAVAIERARTLEQAEAVQSINVAFLMLSRWARMIRQRSRSLKKNMEQGEATLGEKSTILQEMNDILQEMESPKEPGYHSVERDLKREVNLTQLLKQVAASQEAMPRLQKVAAHVGVKAAGILNLEGIQPLCLVNGNRLLLEFAFNILLDNAITAIEKKEKAPVALNVKCLTKDDFVHISILDTGGGINPEIEKDLFRVPLNSKKGGFGYGAVTVGLIFKVHKGGIKVEHTGPEGTKIAAWLPAKSG